MSSPGPARLNAAFLLLTLIWGTTWAAIRLGLEGLPPFTGVALRFLVAGTLLLAMVPVFGVRFWRCWARRSASPSTTGRCRMPPRLAWPWIAYTIPIVAVAVGAFAFGEPITGKILAGGALVLAGVAIVSRFPSRAGAHERRPKSDS